MDPVGDALTRIKNGYMVGKVSVEVRFSNLIWKLAELLKKEDYVSEVKKNPRMIIITLKYNARTPAISDIKRVSRPSLRIYKGFKDLPRVLNGLGIAVVSTPKGLMTDRQARKLKVGGEVLALVW